MLAPEPFYRERGTPIALRRVIETAARQGFPIDLLTYPVGDPIQVPGLRIMRVGRFLPIRSVPIGMSHRKILLDLFLLFGFLKKVGRRQYRLVHAVEEAAFLAVFLRPWHRTPVLYDMQSSLPEQLSAYPVFGWRPVQRLLAACEAWLIRRADQIVCSAGLLSHVEAIRAGAPVREWTFPPHPIRESAERMKEFRQSLGIQPDSKVIMYTGNLESYQGISRVLEAVPAVRSSVPGAVFLFVGGDPPDGLRLRAHPVWLEWGQALKWIPRKPQREMARFHAMADVLVSPRDNTQNVGIKVFDYMAAGKPIVATDIPAHRTVLDDDRALFVKTDAQSMAEGIIWLLKHPETGERLGRAASRYAESHLGWDAFDVLLGDLYRGMKGTGGESPARGNRTDAES